MFRNVLIGIDRETQGADAIALAQRLAPDADFTFAHVCTGFPMSSNGRSCSIRESNRSRELLDRAMHDSSTDAYKLCTGSFRVGPGLHHLAEQSGADLLVVGSRRIGRAGRVLAADETSRALDGVPCALAVAPLHYAEDGWPLEQIGVAYDGSADGAATLGSGGRLARMLSAELTALGVASLPAGEPSGVWSAFDSALRERIHELTERIANDLRNLGLSAHEGLPPVAIKAACGDTVEELALMSSELDLLIVGSRGYGPGGRLVHGSTGGRMTREARSPLLMLPRAADAGDSPSIQPAFSLHD